MRIEKLSDRSLELLRRWNTTPLQRLAVRTVGSGIQGLTHIPEYPKTNRKVSGFLK